MGRERSKTDEYLDERAIADDEQLEHKRSKRARSSNSNESATCLMVDCNDNIEQIVSPMAAAVAAAAKASAEIQKRTMTITYVRDKVLPRSSGVAQILVKSESEQATNNSVEHLEERKPFKRKTRWSVNKAFVPGMPTILPSNIDDVQRNSYLLQMEIEEVTRKLRQGDFLSPEDVSRSPSPEPIYDANGKRLNTREARKRQELEQKRHEKIQALLLLNQNYKPPADYRTPNVRLHEKVWIPQDAHPEINFVGLLIGPRGNTLKAVEQETGAKIIIRGKGSIKEGKLGGREGIMPGENEPLHAYITGTDQAAIKRGCNKIREIISGALMMPEGQNELRKLQLRELAVLNGTTYNVGGMQCSNCSSDQHKTWECREAPNVTANVICTACGSAGHVGRDCKNPRSECQQSENAAGIDAEYLALMTELGEKETTSNNCPTGNAAFFSKTQQQTGMGNAKSSVYRLPNGQPVVRLTHDSQQQQHTRPSLYQINMNRAGNYCNTEESDNNNYVSMAQAGSYWAAQQQWTYPFAQPPPSIDNFSIFLLPPPPPPPSLQATFSKCESVDVSSQNPSTLFEQSTQPN